MDPTFEILTNQLMEWLKKNHHPHTKIIIDSEVSELVEGIKSNHRAPSE